eukprot:1883024-Prorocentrum_lima.AAC.1
MELPADRPVAALRGLPDRDVWLQYEYLQQQERLIQAELTRVQSRKRALETHLLNRDPSATG